MDAAVEFDLEIRPAGSGPVRAITASGLSLADLPALRLAPFARDWLIVTHLESPELYDRTLADLCRVTGVGGGPIDGTPYYACEPGGALRLFATRAVQDADHAMLLFAPQRPTGAAMARLGLESTERWTPRRLGDGLYVECRDRRVTLFTESTDLCAHVVNGVLRLATGLDDDHVRALAIGLDRHAGRYVVEETREGLRLTRLPSGDDGPRLPEVFLRTRAGWVVEPTPEPPVGTPVAAPADRGVRARMRRMLDALARAALLPPSARQRVRRLFK
ncbi:MAG TPA: hypothetical protein VIM86_09435 [Thermodesulfobacteriota bacterium]